MQLPCAGVTFRFTAIPHCYCRVGALSCTDYFCLHTLTKLFNSEHLLQSIEVALHLEHFALQQNFSSPELPFHLFIFSCFLLCVCSCKKRSLNLFFLSLCLHCVWYELPHSLGTQAVVFVRFIHCFLCSLFRITSFLFSSLKHSLRFDVHANHLFCTNDINQALPRNGWWKPFACDTFWISLVWRGFWSAPGILQRFLQASTPWSFWNL